MTRKVRLEGSGGRWVYPNRQGTPDRGTWRGRLGSTTGPVGPPPSAGCPGIFYSLGLPLLYGWGDPRAPHDVCPKGSCSRKGGRGRPGPLGSRSQDFTPPVGTGPPKPRTIKGQTVLPGKGNSRPVSDSRGSLGADRRNGSRLAHQNRPMCARRT